MRQDTSFKEVMLLLLSCLVSIAFANVEKTIFVAPKASEAIQDASIDNLLLTSLHPNQLTVRTFLNASFPTTNAPHGQETWALLDGLQQDQRYELRVCWLATQPTAFWIDTFEMQEVFQTPELLSSVSAYSYARRGELTDAEVSALVENKYKPSSDQLQSNFLFVRIQAAADYFSLNKTLMETVPPVHVDLILDPYLMNVLPQSLVPTAGYISAIAIFAFFLSGWIYRRMIGYVDDEYDQKPGVEGKKDM